MVEIVKKESHAAVDSMSTEVLVVGLGRIGLPVALIAAESGLTVRGIDVDSEHVAALVERRAPFDEPGLAQLLEAHSGSTFLPAIWADINAADLRRVRWIVLTIGVHEFPYPAPADMSLLHRIAAELVDRDALEGRTLILRTTLPVGASRLLAEHIAYVHDLEVGKDYNLAFVPERLVEGQAITEERNLPKIVGPFSPDALSEVTELFGRIGGRIISLKSPEEAEFVKLIDNAWRHTRFAFANDVAMAASANGVDVLDIIEAANADYGRNAIAMPGPVSGYCLSKDPIIFEYAMQDVEERIDQPSVWMTALRSSKKLVPWTANRCVGPRILVAGLTFKENIDDMRIAFSEPLIETLLEAGHSVDVCDPYLGRNAYTRLWPSVADRIEVKGTDLDAMLSSMRYDTVVLAVRHDEFRGLEAQLAGQGRVVDLWNLYRGLEGRIGLGTQG